MDALHLHQMFAVMVGAALETVAIVYTAMMVSRPKAAAKPKEIDRWG